MGYDTNKTIINLDENFSPYGAGIPFKKFTFPSGCENHIKLTAVKYDNALVTTRIKSSDDIILLLLATDAMRRAGINNIEVFIPYFPYARQDRIMVRGEPFSLKVFTDLINSQNYDKVIVYDVHSDVATALINNVRSIHNHEFVKSVLHDKDNYLIVSPDAGAYKKIFNLCSEIGYKDEIALCNKYREVSTGNIKRIDCEIYNFKNKDLFMVDDICDGGATFNMIADEFRKRGTCGKINLIVSHGIFSKGLDVFPNIDNIYTTNSFCDLAPHNKLTQINLKGELLK
jgi:ribose-phosphate pyrophosphokinase